MWARRNKRGMLADYRWAGCLTCHVPHSARLSIPQQQPTDTLLFLLLRRLHQIILLASSLTVFSNSLSLDPLLLHSGPHSSFPPLSSSYPIFLFIFCPSIIAKFLSTHLSSGLFSVFPPSLFLFGIKPPPYLMQGRCPGTHPP